MGGKKVCKLQSVFSLVTRMSLWVPASYPTQVAKSEWSYLPFLLQGVANFVPDVGRKQIISNVLPALHTVCGSLFSSSIYDSRTS
jgi:hypothetical protein